MATNLTGVYYAPNGSHKLKNIYKKILLIAGKFPKDAGYRANLESIICHRLSIINESEGDRKKIEENISCGSLEMLIMQAEAEFSLVQKMILWKPWEALVERPPPGQWKWPPY